MTDEYTCENETFLLRFGDSVTLTTTGPWPPPEEMDFEGRVYRQISRSKLPADTDMTHLIRGAAYIVKEGE